MKYFAACLNKSEQQETGFYTHCIFVNLFNRHTVKEM